ncbi:MAG: DUF6320 domain-containing protein [Oscillospiraceae bacterium]|jgi:hypothetical protein|nr:DUF6320 domain-containing protein [Oscillospiraceae bacterium]
MSYCVHCGVKLGEAEARCPLCATPVIDPSAPKDPAAPPPTRAYPARTEGQTLTLSRRSPLAFLSLLLLGAAGICLALDFLAGEGMTWSLYPAGVLVLLWVAFAVPLLLRRHRLYSTLLTTATALAGYLYMVERLTGDLRWFFPVVFPSLALFVGMVCLCIALARRWHARALMVSAAAFCQGGLLTLAIELLIVRADFAEKVYWSPYVFLPCLCVAGLLLLIARDRPLYEALQRRLHF